MTTKYIIISFIATFLQTITAQCIGRAVNNGFYGNPINTLAVENAFGPYGPNIAYPANALAYDGIANGIYGPANPLIYDGIANGIYTPASAMAYDNIGYGLTLSTLAASNGGGFSVRSSSPIGVSGVSVESENMVIEGPLLVNGQLPFLGTIGLEGALPVAGNGAVLYSCGNANVGILNEEYPSLVPAIGYGYNGIPTSGYGPAVAGPLGCNRLPYGGVY